MDIRVSTHGPWEKNPDLEPKTKEELEKAMCDGIVDCIEFFDEHYVRTSSKGLVLVVGDRAFLMHVDIKLDHELSLAEMAELMTD